MPSISSGLDMPRSISSGLSPPRYPSFLDANLRSNWGMSRSTSGKLLLRTGTSKQLPLNVTRMRVPSRASASVSGDRSMPSVSVTVPRGEWTVTRVTSASLLRPSVSMSRYDASPRKSPNSLQCSPFGVMSARPAQSPSSRRPMASSRRTSCLALASGLTEGTEPAETKSSQVLIPDSQMALSFFAPTDGSSWNVFLITPGSWAGAR